jgi:hypothetical protein
MSEDFSQTPEPWPEISIALSSFPHTLTATRRAWGTRVTIHISRESAAGRKIRTQTVRPQVPAIRAG